MPENPAELANNAFDRIFERQRAPKMTISSTIMQDCCVVIEKSFGAPKEQMSVAHSSENVPSPSMDTALAALVEDPNENAEPNVMENCDVSTQRATDAKKNQGSFIAVAPLYSRESLSVRRMTGVNEQGNPLTAQNRRRTMRTPAIDCHGQHQHVNNDRVPSDDYYELPIQRTSTIKPVEVSSHESGPSDEGTTNDTDARKVDYESKLVSAIRSSSSKAISPLIPPGTRSTNPGEPRENVASNGNVEDNKDNRVKHVRFHTESNSSANDSMESKRPDDRLIKIDSHKPNQEGFDENAVDYPPKKGQTEGRENLASTTAWIQWEAMRRKREKSLYPNIPVVANDVANGDVNNQTVDSEQGPRQVEVVRDRSRGVEEGETSNPASHRPTELPGMDFKWHDLKIALEETQQMLRESRQKWSEESLQHAKAEQQWNETKRLLQISQKALERACQKQRELLQENDLAVKELQLELAHQQKESHSIISKLRRDLEEEHTRRRESEDNRIKLEKGKHELQKQVEERQSKVSMLSALVESDRQRHEKSKLDYANHLRRDRETISEIQRTLEREQEAHLTAQQQLHQHLQNQDRWLSMQRRVLQERLEQAQQQLSQEWLRVEQDADAKKKKLASLHEATIGLAHQELETAKADLASAKSQVEKLQRELIDLAKQKEQADIDKLVMQQKYATMLKASDHDMTSIKLDLKSLHAKIEQKDEEIIKIKNSYFKLLTLSANLTLKRLQKAGSMATRYFLLRRNRRRLQQKRTVDRRPSIMSSLESAAYAANPIPTVVVQKHPPDSISGQSDDAIFVESSSSSCSI